MKKNIESNDLIEISDFVRFFLKNKLFILICSFFFSLIGYFFSLTQTSPDYSVSFMLKNPENTYYEQYEAALGLRKKGVSNINIINDKTTDQVNSGSINISTLLGLEFQMNLLSIDNLVSYAEQSKHTEIFKEYLNKNKINFHQYFTINTLTNFKEKNQIVRNKYIFKFTKEFNGDAFINDYVAFVKKKTLDQFIIKLKSSISNIIIEIDQNLKIAEAIGLADPILKSANQGFQVINEPEPFFYRGTKVLSQQKYFLNDLLSKTDIAKLDWDPFIDRAVFVSKNKETPAKLYMLSGFFAGFILSILTIYFRKLSKFI